MGFPVPLQEWLTEEGMVREFVGDLFSSPHALGRELVDNRKVLAGLSREPKFGRKLWGFLSLELWQQLFHDRAAYFKQLLSKQEVLA